MKQKLLLIVGPTAVGKTKFSIECAKKFNGEIISADSIQIYKCLDIGSAKATKEEQSQAVHHLIDIIEPDEEFSASEFSELARKKINEVCEKGKLPIICGGTGLFAKSLLYPLSFGNTGKNEEVRKKWERFLEENGKEKLFEELKKVDPESADNIDINNTRRVIRAIEIFEITGQKKSEQNDYNKESEYDFMLIFLNRERNEIYDLINKRVDIMINKGLEKEVENLVKNYKLTKNNQSMQAIGYKEFFEYFEGKKTLEEVKEEIKTASRHYAKRQITFFKNMDSVKILNYNDMEKNLLEVEKWLKS